MDNKIHKSCNVIAAVIGMLSLMQPISMANTSLIEVGCYYQLGKYDGEPIIWRCASIDDANGYLMVSDKILCFKAANSGSNTNNLDSTLNYGDNFWEESTIRQWLNSTDNEGKIQWNNYPPDYEHLHIDSSNYLTNYPYSDEAGFLNETNFSESEKSVFKTVSQWQVLPLNKMNLATNGCNYPYISSYFVTNGRGEEELVGEVKLSELKDSYKGAMYRISDTVFLLDEAQLYSVFSNFGTIGAESIREPMEGSGVAGRLYHSEVSGLYNYWLRTPYNTGAGNTMYMVWEDHNQTNAYTCAEMGIRPAFYLNESTAIIKSGSGTEYDPYILDGVEQEGIAVFTNSCQIDFDVEPMTENDRTLVGMRAVFESLGAEVEWDQNTRTAIAVKDDTKIELQVDNNVMLRNGEEIQLDTPARIVSDRTMVPLRAVSEALNARVDWVEGLHRVVIDKPEDWVETEWNPEWYQEALRVRRYLK